MRKLQWGRILALMIVAGLLVGLGFLMQHTLPEYMPFLQSDFWQMAAVTVYYLGLILLVIFLIVFVNILINNSKVGPKRKVEYKEDDNAYREKALDFIEALGGVANITGVDSCMSRVRVNISDVDEINQSKIQGLGASGIFMSGSQLQAIFGEESELLKRQIEKILLEKRK